MKDCREGEQLLAAARLKLIEELERRKARNDRYDWKKNARPSQLPPPGSWRIWCIMAGRGFGKTRAGAETIRRWVEEGAKHVALVGDRIEEVRRVMIEGESGLLRAHPPGQLVYQPGINRLQWSNGAIATGYSAEAYDNLRGPQFDAAWVDELAKFQNPEAVLDQLTMSLRLGSHPRMVITTTPRPLQFLRDLLQREEVVVTRGSSHENPHLTASYLRHIEQKYGGTRFGAQEIEGRMLEFSSLWRRDMIRVSTGDLPRMVRVVVGVDPAVSAHGDETGIVTAGLAEDGRIFVLDDASGHLTPSAWADRVRRQVELHKADLVMAESNQGGEMILSVLKGLQVRLVRAGKSKEMRATPLAAMYEKRDVLHAMHFPALEEQLLGFEGASSPDRVDALVWAVNGLRGGVERMWVGGCVVG